MKFLAWRRVQSGLQWLDRHGLLWPSDHTVVATGRRLALWRARACWPQRNWREPRTLRYVTDVCRNYCRCRSTPASTLVQLYNRVKSSRQHDFGHAYCCFIFPNLMWHHQYARIACTCIAVGGQPQSSVPPRCESIGGTSLDEGIHSQLTSTIFKYLGHLEKPICTVTHTNTNRLLPLSTLNFRQTKDSSGTAFAVTHPPTHLFMDLFDMKDTFVFVVLGTLAMAVLTASTTAAVINSIDTVVHAGGDSRLPLRRVPSPRAKPCSLFCWWIALWSKSLIQVKCSKISLNALLYSVSILSPLDSWPCLNSVGRAAYRI